MRVRGRRRCVECGEEWSYYETDSVACPACGSLQSVGTEDDRSLHTDRSVDLDLGEVRSMVESRPLREVASAAETQALEYVSGRGFLHGGDLRPIEERFVAASELRHVAGRVRRSLQGPDPAVESHFLDLLEGAPDGERPADVPEALRAARALAIASVVDRYRGEVTSWSADDPDSGPIPLEALRDRTKRIQALDGDVPAAEAELLLEAAREIGQYLRDGDEAALGRARSRLQSPP